MIALCLCVCSCGLSDEGPVQPQSKDDDGKAGFGKKSIRIRFVLGAGRVVAEDLNCIFGYIIFCESWKRQKERNREREQQQQSHV